MQGRTVSARTPAPWVRAWRWSRRNPIYAGLGTAPALSLLAGTILATAFAVRADDAREVAVLEQERASRARERALAAERTALAAKQ